MANYILSGDGLYPLDLEANTDITTFTLGDMPVGAVVVVGISTSEGWVPIVGGTLQPFTPVALSHGHDVKLSVLVSSAGTTAMSLQTQKQGVPAYYDILNQIAENTASPIKVDAPFEVPSLRQLGSWVEGVPRTEYEDYKTSRRVDVIYGNNSLATTTTDELITWVPANMTGLLSPPGFNNNWSFDVNTATFTYTGSTTVPFEITVGGTVDSDSVTDTDHIFVRLVEVAGVMTGTSKRYAAGRSAGQVTSSIGFTSNGFGLFNPGDTVQLQVAKDFAGVLILTDMIAAFRPL